MVLATTAQAAGQSDDVDDISTPVIQQIPGGGSLKLNVALGQLGRNPRDVAALVDAGQAALEIGDVDAAVGFLQRADTLSPGNPRVKAGLAGAYVRHGDPFTAIRLFAEAEVGGPIDPALLTERGLAYDLVGDNVTAQRFYRAALAAGTNDEAVRRLALSQAMSGDRRSMETTLAPLLQRQDKAAWRIRAFSFAILGLADEAESIARSTMPADLAAGITPYLRYMPRLTPAQQAAAANFGHFPRAAEIGLDDPRIAQYAKPRGALASASQTLVPAGQPMGRAGKPGGAPRRTRNDRDRPVETSPAPAPTPARIAAAAPPNPVPTREAMSAPVQLAVNTARAPISQQALVQQVPVQQVPVQQVPVQQVSASQLPPKPVATPAPAPMAVPNSAGAAVTASALPVPGFAALDPAPPHPSVSGFDLAQLGQPIAPAPSPRSAEVSPVAKPAPQPRTIADLFADLGTPSREAVPVAGAVDIRRISAPRPAADPASRDATSCKPGVTGKAAANCKTATPLPPSHPSRIWVQLATGRDKQALGFDWRKLNREEAEVLRNRKGFTSAWGQTNRLLTGPFESEAAANGFLGQLRRAGVGGSFVWTSPAGQVVDALVGK